MDKSNLNWILVKPKSYFSNEFVCSSQNHDVSGYEFIRNNNELSVRKWGTIIITAKPDSLWFDMRVYSTSVLSELKQLFRGTSNNSDRWSRRIIDQSNGEVIVWKNDEASETWTKSVYDVRCKNHLYKIKISGGGLFSRSIYEVGVPDDANIDTGVALLAYFILDAESVTPIP